jgi:predicted ATPase
MTAADLRALADVLDRLAAAGFVVALELGGDLVIRATPAAATGEPFSDGTRFSDATGWTEHADEGQAR